MNANSTAVIAKEKWLNHPQSGDVNKTVAQVEN
jgi:hypothetical protein